MALDLSDALGWRRSGVVLGAKRVLCFLLKRTSLQNPARNLGEGLPVLAHV